MAERRERIILSTDVAAFEAMFNRRRAIVEGMSRFYAQQRHPLDRIDLDARVKGEPQLWQGDQA